MGGANGDDSGVLGRRFGEFVTIERLGAGGMAEVYLAARPRAGTVELAALKHLHPHLAWELDFVRMFLEEVEISVNLHHPNIAGVFDYGTGEGGHYLAMEYVHGANLRTILRELDERQSSLDFAVGIVVELAAALHYAHQWRSPDLRVQGLVHRDITPSNVMIGYDGRVKLLDFGIARAQGRTQYTRAGTIKGNVGYMSPEQCRGDSIDRRSDVFGLGVLLYELSTQRRAFFADNEFAAMGRILAADYESPLAVVPEYPAELAQILGRCLAVDPDDRFADAAAVQAALEQFAASHGLDLGIEGRRACMRALFGDVPPPHVGAADLRRAERFALRHRRRPWVPWLAVGAASAGVVVGLALGGVPWSTTSVSADVPTPAQTRVSVEQEPERPKADNTPVIAPMQSPAAPLGAAVAGSESAPSDDVDVAEDASESVPAPEQVRRRRGRPKRRPQRRSQSDDAAPSIDPEALLAPSLRDSK